MSIPHPDAWQGAAYIKSRNRRIENGSGRDLGPVVCTRCKSDTVVWHEFAKPVSWKLFESDGHTPHTHTHEPPSTGGNVDLSPVFERINAVENVQTLLTSKVEEATLSSATALAEAARILAEAQDALNSANAHRTIEVRMLPTGDIKVVGRQHVSFDKLIKLLAARVNVFLRGPAGSGKTTAVKWAAEALGLDFYAISIGPQTSKSDIIGFINGSGEYVRTVVRDAYEHGGVLLIDEFDAGNAAVLTILNMILANDIASFADGMVNRHPDFYVVAAGNTYGRGADSLYVGRSQLDAATLNRFAILDWDYDWDFVAELAGNLDWTMRCKRLADRVSDLKMRIVIGPRQAIMGAQLLAAGFPQPEVEHLTIWAPVSNDDKSKILAGV